MEQVMRMEHVTDSNQNWRQHVERQSFCDQSQASIATFNQDWSKPLRNGETRSWLACLTLRKHIIQKPHASGVVSASIIAQPAYFSLCALQMLYT